MAASSTGTSSHVGTPLDCVRAIRYYVEKMLRPKDKALEVQGMKVLILDDETVRAAVLAVL